MASYQDFSDIPIRLDKLVRNLTLSEVRHLRLQLNSIQIPCDICTEFPIELLICISDYLDLEDILNIRLVSRSWNELFTSPDICVGTIKKHFYPVWDRRFRHLNLVPKEEPRTWLQHAAINRLRRLHGLYHCVAVYEEVHCASSERSSSQQYCNGRIAFKLGIGDRILVRDLRSESEVIFVDERRESIGYWLLSDDMIVLVKNRP